MDKKKKNSVSLSRRCYKWLAVLLVVPALLLALLPFGVKYVLLNVLVKQGAHVATLDSVDLNLFTGKFALHELEVQGEGDAGLALQQLALEISPGALWDRHIHIDNISLSGLQLDVEQLTPQQWRIAGLDIPPASSPATTTPEKPAEPWSFTLDQLEFNGLQIELALAQFQQTVQLEALQLGPLSSLTPTQLTPYALQLQVAQSAVTLKGSVQPLLDIPTLQSELDVQRLPLVWLAPYLKEQGVESLDGELNLQLAIKVALQAEQPVLEGTLRLALNKLSARYQHYLLQNETLFWQGDVAYQVPTGEDDLGVRLKGEIMLAEFSLDDQQLPQRLAQFKRLALLDIELQASQQLTMAALQLAQLQLLVQKRPFVALEALDLNSLSYDGKQQLEIDALLLQGLALQLELTPQGELAHLSALAEAQAEAEEEIASAPSEVPVSTPWHYRINTLNIANNSHVVINDYTLQRPFQGELSPLTVSLQGIDSSKPEQPILLSFDSQLNKHQWLQMSGDVKPFLKQPEVDLEGNIKALALPPLSAYVEKHLGYYLKRGQLDGDFELGLAQQQLDVALHLNLKKFNLEEGDPGKVKSLTDQLSMPLDTALDLLRDGDDNIKLELNIDGDINDPQFDASKVINRAMGRATQMAAVSYVKHLLYPWGTLLSLAEMAGDMMVTEFEPVTFNPAEIELHGDHELYLDKLNELLQQRPEIALNICGLVSEQDRQALMLQVQQKKEMESVMEVTNEQLLDLAMQRNQIVKDYLVDAGTDPGRLFDCQPEMGKVEKNLPLVRLHL